MQDSFSCHKSEYCKILLWENSYGFYMQKGGKETLNFFSLRKGNPLLLLY